MRCAERQKHGGSGVQAMDRWVQEVMDDLRQSRKYRDLCDQTLVRMAEWALVRHPDVKAACKAARRKLHQVYGAYVGQVDAKRIARALEGLDVDDPRPVCTEILRGHVSTAERLDILEDAFPALWREIGRPDSVMDLACGLNPFALPWMGLDGAAYYACDIDVPLMGCTQCFLDAMGIRGKAECRDLLVCLPEHQVDVALLLKVLPCLEQQEKGAGMRVLQGLEAKHIVASFPARSIGGRDKGMVAHYDGVLRQMAEALHRQVCALAFPGETFYVLT